MEDLTLGNLLKIQREEYEAELALHRAEITQLRAELAESRASEHGLFGRLETYRQDEAALKAEIAAERGLADRLAECAAIVQCDVEDVAPDQVWEEIPIDNWNNLTRAVQNVRTRMNK